MQVLYSMNRDKEITLTAGVKRYHRYVDKTYELYLYTLYLLYKLCGISIKESNQRKSKHIISAEDKSFTPKLWENEIIQSLHNNLKLQKAWKQAGFTGLVDEDYLTNKYKSFSKIEEYAGYMGQKASTIQNHKDIIQLLFKSCIKDENFVDMVEAYNPHWSIDDSLVVGSIKRTLKSLPNDNEDFFESYLPEDEPVNEYGEELLKMVLQKDEELLKIIEPALQNWDISRVAILDLILLKMAVCELMYFPTIPTKVTLNEFVEVSKLYSTDKSKDFINGILDRLLKQLSKEGKIKKEGRGLVE